jgi:osmoprotectant transport system substrate-binding protein
VTSLEASGRTKGGNMRARSRFRLLALPLAIVAFGVACGKGAEGEVPGAGEGGAVEPVVIGAEASAESQLVARMYELVLEEAGRSVQASDFQSQEDLLAALEDGRIDLAPVRLASALIEVNGTDALATEVDRAREELAGALQERGLAVLEPSPANTGPAVVVTEETSRDLDLDSVADLDAVAGELTVAGWTACPEDPACLPRLRNDYGVAFREVVADDPGWERAALALMAGDADAALLPATAGVIDDQGWVVLEEEDGVLPANHITPVIRAEALTGETERLLNQVSASLSLEKMRLYTGKIQFFADGEVKLGEDPTLVATAHLNNESLL